MPRGPSFGRTAFEASDAKEMSDAIIKAMGRDGAANVLACQLSMIVGSMVGSVGPEAAKVLLTGLVDFVEEELKVHQRKKFVMRSFLKEALADPAELKDEYQ